jgi:hypothetical protein
MKRKDKSSTRKQRFKELSLAVVPLKTDYPGSYDTGIEIGIDSRPFLHLVSKVEMGFRGQVAGGYVSALLKYLGMIREAADGRQLFDGPGVFGRARAATLLVCGCGDASCWSLDADITVEDAVVRWDGLSSTPGRRNPAWNYAAIEPLVFDRTTYFRTVEALVPEIMATIECRNA